MIGTVGAQAMAGALKVNQTLTTLDLRYNHIGEVGVQALAEALKINQTLTSLDLTDNQIGAVGAQVLAEALYVNHTLTTLNLTNNEIKKNGFQLLYDVNNHWQKWNQETHAIIESLFRCEQSFLSQLPGDQCILNEILGYVMRPQITFNGDEEEEEEEEEE